MLFESEGNTVHTQQITDPSRDLRYHLIFTLCRIDLDINYPLLVAIPYEGVRVFSPIDRDAAPSELFYGNEGLVQMIVLRQDVCTEMKSKSFRNEDVG